MLRSVYRLLRDIHRYFRFTGGNAVGAFRGVFGSFEEARAAAPAGKRMGYDHRDLAEEYRDRLDLHLESTDYPVLFHLQRLLPGPLTVLDFGGNVGVHYLRYRRHLDFTDVRWIVLDLPEITRAGERACAEVPGVSFVNDVSGIRADRIDLLFASGSMEYAASPDLMLRELIARGLRPGHLIYNSLPLYEGPRFVTLQNGGLVFYPQYVFNRGEYISAVEALGYRLVDRWNDNISSCHIPFHPERAVRVYTGLRFADYSTLTPTVLTTSP